MKSDSLKNNQHPEPDSVAPKKLWINPEVEVVSVLSGLNAGYEGGFPPASFTRANVS